MWRWLLNWRFLNENNYGSVVSGINHFVHKPMIFMRFILIWNQIRPFNRSRLIHWKLLYGKRFVNELKKIINRYVEKEISVKTSKCFSNIYVFLFGKYQMRLITAIFRNTCSLFFFLLFALIIYEPTMS